MKIFKIYNDTLKKYEYFAKDDSVTAIGNNKPISTDVLLTDTEKKYWLSWDENTNTPILDSARLDADTAIEAEKTATLYRTERAAGYIQGFAAAGITPEKDVIKALGDCIDALISTIQLNNLTLDPKLQAIIAVVETVKQEYPKP